VLWDNQGVASNEIRFDCRRRGDRGARTAFGPFQFDRHQYADALRALSTAIGSGADAT